MPTWKEVTAANPAHSENFARKWKMLAAQAIVVYPAGVEKAWTPAPYAKTTEEEDLKFVADMVDSCHWHLTQYLGQSANDAFFTCQLHDPRFIPRFFQTAIIGGNPAYLRGHFPQQESQIKDPGRVTAGSIHNQWF